MKIHFDIDLNNLWTGDESIAEAITGAIQDEIQKAIRKTIKEELKNNRARIERAVKQVSNQKIIELEKLLE